MHPITDGLVDILYCLLAFFPDFLFMNGEWKHPIYPNFAAYFHNKLKG